jgi:hypothetical protein
VINAQIYFDWHVVTKLMELKAPLESRSPKGQTPLLHCAGSGSTKNVVQLLIQHGANMDATDAQGNTMWHLIIRRANLRVLKPLAEDGIFLQALGSWFVPNAAGRTPVQSAHGHRHRGGESADIHRIMETAQAQWEHLVVPLLETELTSVMQLRDLARMALQYIDGSGKPWPEPDEPEGFDAGIVTTAVQAKQHNVDEAPPLIVPPPPPAINPAEPIIVSEAEESSDDEGDDVAAPGQFDVDEVDDFLDADEGADELDADADAVDEDDDVEDFVDVLDEAIDVEDFLNEAFPQPLAPPAAAPAAPAAVPVTDNDA